MTLTQQLRQMPPKLVRVLARKGRRAMTNRDIARLTGWSLPRIARVIRRNDWSWMSVAEVDLFCRSCGVDILHPRRQKDYLKRRGFAYIRNTPSVSRYLIGLLKEVYEPEKSKRETAE